VTAEYMSHARAILARDESSGSNVKRLLSYSRRYSENNGCCEQRYKRRAWFVVVVVVGCSPFSLQMISSADTCLFMPPSVPRIVDATSSKRTLTVRGMGQLYRLRSVGDVSRLYKVSRNSRYSFHLKIECLEIDCSLISM